MSDPVVMYRGGVPTEVQPELVDEALRQGMSLESPEEHASRLTTEQHDEEFGGAKGMVTAGLLAGARGLTGGLSDVAIDAAGGADQARAFKEAHPFVSVGAEVLGTLSPAGFGGFASRVGQRIAGTAEGASLATKLVRGAAGYGAEGAILGTGSAISELALSDDPLTTEHMASVLKSNILLGGGVGAGFGVLGTAVGHGLGKAKGALDEIAARTATEAEGGLAALDAKGLRAAHDAELEVLAKAQVGERASAAEGIGAYRDAVKEANPWLVVDQGEPAALLNQSNRALRNAMNDPVGLAKRPADALKALRVQEQGLLRATEQSEKIAARLASTNEKIAKGLELELATLPEAATHVELAGSTARRYGVFADAKVTGKGAEAAVKVTRDEAAGFLGALQRGEVAGSEQVALKKLPELVEANRALQAKIEAASVSKAELSSERLREIAAARDGLTTTPKAPASLAEKMGSGAAYSMAAGTVGAVPIVGPMLAPFAGAAAASLVGEKVFGKLAKSASEQAARASKAVGAFMDTASRVAPKIPILASKALASARFGEPVKGARARTSKSESELVRNFHARAGELRSQMMYGPTGKAEMRTEARVKMGTRLDPIRAISPAHALVADRLETLAARKYEYLANALPKKPDVGGLQSGPDDRWQPSQMEMMSFARKVAGVENPAGIEDRLASGQVTPEDAEVMREVYPERYAAIQAEIAMKLPELRKALSYQRRLALSIFTGQAVDPAMHPAVLNILQRQFASEHGTEGGKQPPKAQPQFGSVKAEIATPTQQREGSVT